MAVDFLRVQSRLVHLPGHGLFVQLSRFSPPPRPFSAVVAHFPVNLPLNGNGRCSSGRSISIYSPILCVTDKTYRHKPSKNR